MAGISRRKLLRSVAAAGAAIGSGLWSEKVDAQRNVKTVVAWTDVELPDGSRSRRRERVLRSVLKTESSRMEWGDHAGRLEASVRVTQFVVSEREDVVRVTCTALGKLKNGPAVRTHFSFGDHPRRRDELESTVLTLVARGVVTRLAAIARAKSARGR